MRSKGKSLTIFLITAAFLILVSEIFIWTSGSHALLEYVSAFSYFLLFFMGGLVGIISGYRIGLKNTFGKSLYVLGFAQIIYTVAIMSFDYYKHIAAVSHYPSIADVFYLLFAPCVAAGLGLIVHLHRIKINARITASVIFIIFISTCFTTYFLGFPAVRAAANFADVVSLFYIINNTLLISSVLIVLFISRGKVYHGLYWYLSGIVVHFIGDVLFVHRVENSTYVGFGDPAEIAYVMSAALLTLGIMTLHHSFSERIQIAHAK